MTTRVIGADTFTLLYDGSLRMVAAQKNGATIAGFAYDGDGRMAVSSMGGVTTYTVGGYFELKITTSGSKTVKYYSAGSARIAMRQAGVVTYLFGDHLGSTSVTFDDVTNDSQSQGYTAFGEQRYFVSENSPPFSTDYQYTGQKAFEKIGLYFYNARWYDSNAMLWMQPDTLIPDPGNALDWNRYQYTRGNPLRYNDPFGHWTEDQLVAMLGEDWREKYFGEQGIFHGRDNLLSFLTSNASVDEFNLYVVKEFFRLASYMTSLGINFDNYDAIGCRFSIMVGYGGVAGGNVDALLNINSGELSYFSAIDGGAGYGATIGAGAGYFLIKNLPSNQLFRGPGKSVGTSLAYIVGANVEGFSGGVIDGNSDVYNGLYAGGVLGKGFSFYGTISYTFFEAMNVNQAGYTSFPYLNRNPTNILSDIGDMLWNDILKLGN